MGMGVKVSLSWAREWAGPAQSKPVASRGAMRAKRNERTGIPPKNRQFNGRTGAMKIDAGEGAWVELFVVDKTSGAKQAGVKLPAWNGIGKVRPSGRTYSPPKKFRALVPVGTLRLGNP
jgi:hypothetical protein